MVYDANDDGRCDVCGQRAEEECSCTKQDMTAVEDDDIQFYT
ncbi:hypothetical protein D1BOALGB6SA_10330 [Olavius sp. associated proteobacterium Delta 1]|nr:hypothetical protein D1BOALGB6SA_10330 [Olavius sp. associated proteobacterium Delta 1]